MLCLGANRLGGTALVDDDAADDEDDAAGGLIPGLAMAGRFGDSGSLSTNDDAVETGRFNELALAMPPAAAPTGLLIALPAGPVTPPPPLLAAGAALLAAGPGADLAVGTGRCLALISAFS